MISMIRKYRDLESEQHAVSRLLFPQLNFLEEINVQ